ncbi:MAG: AAA family ATPase [Clostridia bacterium]|nr:AAA family ATPase [Clostridia bacterium]
MYIEKLSIESFGSLSQVSYDLTSGVNIFRGKNESGKSTLAAFIKFIFYGLCGKTPDQTMSEKTRYTNWDHGISGGALVINVDGVRYRIERRVTPATKASGKETVKIIDLASGAEVFEKQCPGEVFFGVGEDIFAQTAFSAQGSGSVVDSEKMNVAIDNMLFSGNEALNIKTALKKLDEARAYLLHKNRKGGKLYDMANEMEKLEERIAVCEENERFLADRNRVLSENRLQLEDNKKQLKKAEDRLIHYESSLILSRFEDLDKKRDALRKAHAEEAALVMKHTVDGFLPDDNYIAALRTLHARMGITEDEKASLVKQKDAFAATSLTPEQRTVIKTLDEMGGKDKAVKALRDKRQKRARAHRAFFVFLILSLLAAGASALLTLRDLLPAIPYLSYIAYGVTALSLFTAIIKLATAPSVKELYRKFSSETEEDALHRIEDALHAELVVREEDARYARLMDAMEATDAEAAKQLSQAAILLGKWKMPCTDRASLLNCIDKALEVSTAVKEARRVLREASVAYEVSEEALREYSREEHAKRYQETAYVGKTEVGEIDTIKRTCAFCQKKEEALLSQIRAIELEIASRSAVTENLEELKNALGELKETYNDYAEKYKAYLLAYEAIKKSGESLRAKIAPALSESASALMKASTQGKYSDIGVDNEMTLSFRTDDAAPSREVGFMSAGTKALTYISLRLSLIRLLFRGKMPPTVFDESFSWLDNTRLASMMSLLKTYSQSAQVIVMTCCDREYDAVADKASVNLIDFGQ